MLEVVAHHDPIDPWLMRSHVRERHERELEKQELKEALSNLEELGLVEGARLSHWVVHITGSGWRLLGGETERHERSPDVDVGDTECRICAADSATESDWSSLLY